MSNLIKKLINNDYNLSIDDIEKNKNYINLDDNEKRILLEYYLMFNKNPKLEIIRLLNDELKFNDYLILNIYLTNENKLNLDIIKYFSTNPNLINSYGIELLTYYLSNNKYPSIKIIHLLITEINVLKDLYNSILYFYCQNQNINKLNPEIIYLFKDQVSKKNLFKKHVLKCYLENNKNPNLLDIKLLLNYDKTIMLNNSYIRSYISNKNIEKLNIEIIRFLQRKIKKDDNEIIILNSYLYSKNNETIDINIVKQLYKRTGNTDIIKYKNDFVKILETFNN